MKIRDNKYSPETNKQVQRYIKTKSSSRTHSSSSVLCFISRDEKNSNREFLISKFCMIHLYYYFSLIFKIFRIIVVIPYFLSFSLSISYFLGIVNGCSNVFSDDSVCDGDSGSVNSIGRRTILECLALRGRSRRKCKRGATL